MSRFNWFLLFLAAVVALVLSTVFIVDERKQALVLTFGRVDKEITEPGIYFKLPPPFQSKIIYEKRILPLETSEVPILPVDGKRRVAAAFARWRITNMQTFREAVGDERGALPRLERILNDSLGKVLGSESADAVLSVGRDAILDSASQLSTDEADKLGVEIVDVRIRTWFLPQQTLESTYNRMIQDRNAIAVGLRASGEEKAVTIRAIADAEAAQIESEAKREASIVKGRADAERNAIFAEAYGRDEEFFAFTRSLTAYEQALKGNNSSIVMSPDSDFFGYLRDQDGAN